MSQAPVAVFDLDGTLSARDTLVPFLQSLNPTGTIVGLIRAMPWLVSSIVARENRDRAKTIVLKHAVGGLQTDVVEDQADRFVTTVAMNSSVVEGLQRHREDGLTLAIATAAPTFLAKAFGRRLDIGLVVGTEMEVVGGTYTGRCIGKNVRSHEKARRVQEYIGPSLDYAYGNLPDDAPMLRLASHGFVVRNGAIEPFYERSA